MANVLLVVGDKTALTADDTALQSRLSSTLGHTVTLASDTDADASAGKSLIILTASVNANELLSTYKNSTLPILALQGGSANMWPNLGLCSTTTSTSGAGWFIVATGNPLAGGNSGSTIVWSSSSAEQRYTNNLISGATRIATTGSSDTGRDVFFDVAAGTTLVDGTNTAAGRRIGLGQYDPNVSSFVTAAWWAMFDASVGAIASGLSVSASASPANILTTGTTTVTATATGGSGTKTYAWTKVSGPAGTFANAAVASTTFTPTGGAGTYVLRCTVTDSSGAATGDVSVFVSEPSSYVTLTSVDVATGWTATGGTNLEVLTDASGDTFVTSSDNPTDLELTGTLGALTAPAAGDPLTVLIGCDKLGATTGSITAKLIESGTLRSTVTVSSIPNGTTGSSVTGQITVNFPSADIAAVTNWAALTLTLLCTTAP